MITFTGAMKLWSNNEGRMHFITVPETFCDEIKAHSLGNPRGFGSVKVAATIDDVTWQTSIFPSKISGGYFLPVKIEICRKSGLGEGDAAKVRLELLP